MPDTQALVSHIVSQTRQNVEFLVSQDEISREAGREILAKLPSASTASILALSEQTSRLMIPEPTISAPVSPPPPASTELGPPVRRNVPPPPVQLSRAKAIWGYNENGQEQNDLSFRAGDVIEVVAETNADWWTGKINGKQGLFPSNYVEKMDSSSFSPPSYPPDIRKSPVPYGPSYQSPPPSNYQLAPPAQYMPPAPPQGYNPYMGPPMQPAPVQVVQQEAPPQQKPSRFGGLGQTAAGGVGFGAGSAVGSGIINAIF
ncbi:hypothetical protein EW146_g246 [Bondarzewia mesenterica]|uniref:SH3 domain-containing protein n=1 Tax=Bondarzewia mesenterica TaxID=1095465 RepID=A0A4S4M7J0_9AGAM|nr:hypothetical protein EW146_g246 [Bondarzewia mesenterica]